MKHKPAPLEEQAELVDNFGQSHFVRAGGVHGLEPVVVILSEEGVGGVHKLHPLRHGRGDKGDGIGLVVGLGGEDKSLAPQVLVTAGGDVALDGLAPFGRVDASDSVVLGRLIQSSLLNSLPAKHSHKINSLVLCFIQGTIINIQNAGSVWSEALKFHVRSEIK